MNSNYSMLGDKSIEEIDAELEAAVIADRKQKIISFIVIFLIIFLVFRNPIIFNIRALLPFAKSYSNELINPNAEPLQVDIITEATTKMKEHDGETDQLDKPIDSSKVDLEYINSKKHPELLTVKTLDNSSKLRLLPMAKYSISGRTIAVNHFFGIFQSKFDKLALFDIGIARGDISKPDFIKNFMDVTSEKVYYNGARRLRIYFKEGKSFNDIPYSPDYVSSHKSHIHVIPANINIFAALLRLKKYDLVQMDGLLVDLFTENRHYKGSLSRSDVGPSRGNGSCELMYVKKVQIGNKIYE